MWFRRSSHSCPASAPRANCPRRSKATTPDSLWASGRRAPEPGRARSEATREPQRRRSAGSTKSSQKKGRRRPILVFPDARRPSRSRGQTKRFPIFPSADRLRFLGKLPKEERSDDAGQFVGKRAGRAKARMHKERSDDRSPATAPCSLYLNKQRAQKKAARRRPRF